MVKEEQPASCGVTTEQLLAALKYHFNHEVFRPNQQEAIHATLSGRDSLLILPTGARVSSASSGKTAEPHLLHLERGMHQQFGSAVEALLSQWYLRGSSLHA